MLVSKHFYEVSVPVDGLWSGTFLSPFLLLFIQHKHSSSTYWYWIKLSVYTFHCSNFFATLQHPTRSSEQEILNSVGLLRLALDIWMKWMSEMWQKCGLAASSLCAGYARKCYTCLQHRSKRMHLINAGCWVTANHFPGSQFGLEWQHHSTASQFKLL